MNLDPPFKSGLPGAGMDTTMVNGMRLLLSSATLLTLFIDPESAGRLSKITWLIFSAYTLHSLLLYVLAVLGLGSNEAVSWGTMLYQSDAQGALQQGLWLWVFAPGLVLAILITAMSFINFGVDLLSNPHLREG